MSHIITANGGSSSIKFSLWTGGHDHIEVAVGKIDALGAENGTLTLQAGAQNTRVELGKIDHAQGLSAIMHAIQPILEGGSIIGVGHRVVHGGTEYDAPVVLNDKIVSSLEQFSPLAPLHQPFNLLGVRGAMASFPDALQVACFDTAFHRGHSRVNDTYALPREYYDNGVRRYGFHGLSYTYIAGELEKIDTGKHGRCVLAHLGNGASMCAMQDGRSVTSSMGFSALDGLAMGSRCGQIDPGVLLYMLDHQKLDSAEITDLLYKRSGLLGLSGLSNDMRTLEQSKTPEAQQAIEYFTHRIRRELGAMAAELGGIDTLVFSGGIGENSALVRQRVCENMGWLGIEVDEARNQSNAPLISTGQVAVRVIPTNEELVIARAVMGFLDPPA